jgi:hypothetical protein
MSKERKAYIYKYIQHIYIYMYVCIDIYIVICGVMRCRYVTPQWHQLLMNSTAPPADLTSAVETEACLDGWTFDQSEFDSTIVTEVHKYMSRSGLFLT